MHPLPPILLFAQPVVTLCALLGAQNSQFVVTKAPPLVGSAKTLLKRLAQLSAGRRGQQGGSSGSGGGVVANGGAKGGAPEDTSLTCEASDACNVSSRDDLPGCEQQYSGEAFCACTKPAYCCQRNY